MYGIFTYIYHTKIPKMWVDIPYIERLWMATNLLKTLQGKVPNLLPLRSSHGAEGKVPHQLREW